MDMILMFHVFSGEKTRSHASKSKKKKRKVKHNNSSFHYCYRSSKYQPEGTVYQSGSGGIPTTSSVASKPEQDTVSLSSVIKRVPTITEDLYKMPDDLHAMLRVNGVKAK